MVGMLASSPVDRGTWVQDPSRLKPKTIKLVFDAFSLSAQLSGVRTKINWLEIGIIWPSGVTNLPTDCCFSYLAL